MTLRALQSSLSSQNLRLPNIYMCLYETVQRVSLRNSLLFYFIGNSEF